MRWLLAAASLVVVILSTALVIRTVRQPTPAATAPPVTPQPAQTGCADTRLRPAPVLPEAAAAPLQLVVAEGVKLSIDGAEPGPSLFEGLHAVEATAPGNKPAKVQLLVEAFTPVLLDVRPSSGAVTVLIVGGRCGNCPNAVANLDLKYRTDAPGALSEVAKALAEGDWLQGAKMLRGIAPGEREAPESTRLLAVLCAFAGRPSLVREHLERLDDPPLRAALLRRDALEELKPVRQLQTATARWNATTDRFQRLTDRFVAEAPKPLTTLTTTFGALSTKFVDAQEKKDAIGCESALESANAALTGLIMQLRAARPDDCAWQKRISEAL